MNIHFVNQYYPPDAAPTGVMLESVAERLAQDGHSVTVMTSVSAGYSQSSSSMPRSPGPSSSSSSSASHKSNVRLLRIRAFSFGRRTFIRKLLDYSSFAIAVAWRLLFTQPKPDLVVALTTPPYLSVLVRLVTGLRRIPAHAHWVMDLYPDAMVAHGMLKRRDGIVGHLLVGLTRWGSGGQRSGAVVTLGPDMAAAVDAYLPDGRAAEWVPLWATVTTAWTADLEEWAEPVATWRKKRGWSDNEVVLLYSGNMGLAHRFGEFLEYASGPSGGTPTDSCVRLVFAGGGKRRREIEEFLDSVEPVIPVQLLDYVPSVDLATHLLSADVHLASLDPAWDGTMVPSKLQGSFAIGRPVIFVGSRTCAIGQWVLESGGGWVVEPGVPETLVAAVAEACEDREREKRGRAAREFAAKHFDRNRNVERLAGIFGDCKRGGRQEGRRHRAESGKQEAEGAMHEA